MWSLLANTEFLLVSHRIITASMTIIHRRKQVKHISICALSFTEYLQYYYRNKSFSVMW